MAAANEKSSLEQRPALTTITAKLLELRNQLACDSPDLVDLTRKLFDLADWTSKLAQELLVHVQAPEIDGGKQQYFVADVRRTELAGELVLIGEMNAMTTPDLNRAQKFDQADIDALHERAGKDSTELLPIPVPLAQEHALLVVPRLPFYFRELADAEAVALKKAKKAKATN